MKKRIVLCAIALCVSTLSPLSAYAVASPSEVSQVLQNSEAYMLSPDGERIDIDITDVEVRQIPVPVQYRTQSNYSDFVAYEVNAKTKTSQSSYKKNGIDASASLTMTWIDGPRVDNKITNLTGYCTVAKGIFDYGNIYWGSTYVIPKEAPHKQKVGESFNVDINYKSDDKVFGKVQATSIAYIISPKDDNKYSLVVNVSPTIFS